MSPPASAISRTLIRRQFIASPHRTVLVLKPDQEQAEREAKEEEARLAKARAPP